MKTKRLIIASLMGLFFGFVCYGLASSGSSQFPAEIAASMIIGRLLIGFAIGISLLKMKHWSLHGLFMGFIFGLPAAFGAMAGGDNPEYSGWSMFLLTLIAGMIYGLLIELITTVVFKARQ